MSHSLTEQPDSNRLLFTAGHRSIALHPIWLRERTIENGMVDAGSLQRLYDPADIDPSVHAVEVLPGSEATTVVWSDGHTQAIRHDGLARELGWEHDTRSPPRAIPWATEPAPFPRFEWPDLDDTEVLIGALDAFWTHGFVVFSGTPTAPGSLEEIASRFGPVRPTNFGTLFDVFSKPNPSDLAYTPIELKAHTDNPYRRPVPGIQFLHCLVNDATGGESTLVDGHAAFDDFREADPEGHQVLVTTMVTYRYQYADEHLVDRSPILEVDPSGGFVGIRNSDRLDFVDAIDPDTLDIFYRARTGLRRLLNDPGRRASFLLGAGDVLMMNNRRLLHGRSSFELATGMRHLQGCYIELDGPDMLSRKLRASA